MKNRRNIIVAFLLCACLIVGVGYAAVSDTLDITGSADIDQTGAQEAFNQDVYFSNTVVIGETVVNGVAKDGAAAGNTSSRNADNVDKVSFTVVSLQGAGDTATFTYTIINAGDVNATVSPRISSNTNEEYFEVYSNWQGQPKNLPAAVEGTPTEITYTVTVKLKKTPTSETTTTGSFVIELTATSTADVDVNP